MVIFDCKILWSKYRTVHFLKLIDLDGKMDVRVFARIRVPFRDQSQPQLIHNPHHFDYYRIPVHAHHGEEEQRYCRYST
jgi:hypothetical protein